MFPLSSGERVPARAPATPSEYVHLHPHFDFDAFDDEIALVLWENEMEESTTPLPPSVIIIGDNPV